MAQKVDIVYEKVLSTICLKKIVADNRSFSSLIQRAPYNIVSIVASYRCRPIALIFGIIEEKVKICQNKYKTVCKKKE